MSIFNLLHLEPMLHTLASVWTLAGELVTAGALLWCLNALARFIRLAYDAGRWTGMFWRFYVVPAVLFLADWISWGVAQVDWLEVRRVSKLCFVHSAAVTVLTVRTVVRIVRAVVQAVRFGVPAIYNWIEAHYIDIPQTDPHSVEDGLVLTDIPQTDCPVRTVDSRTEGESLDFPAVKRSFKNCYGYPDRWTERGRYIERSIDRNERPKSAVLRRRHGRLVAL